MDPALGRHDHGVLIPQQIAGRSAYVADILKSLVIGLK